LGKRLASSDRTRSKILKAARAQLESSGFLNFTVDGLARASGITRQTIHNIFGTKTGVLEALFDQIALEAGMERMGAVMQQKVADAMLSGFVEVFTGFWSKNRLLLRRIHGLAAIDLEFGSAVEARNKRRKGAANRVVTLLQPKTGPSQVAQKSNALYALTSFEFFDALAEVSGSTSEAAKQVHEIVENTILACER
jgi:AcrR family transcriptional regulator